MNRRIEWKGKVILNKNMLFVFIILSIFGLIQITTIAEEVFHVIDGKGAKSICLDFNLKINDSIQNGYLTAHTVFEPTKHWGNLKEYYSWREQTEKMADILFGPAFFICVAFIGGYLTKYSIEFT